MKLDEFLVGVNASKKKVAQVYIDHRSFRELVERPEVRQGNWPELLLDGSYLLFGHRVYIVNTACTHFEVIYQTEVK